MEESQSSVNSPLSLWQPVIEIIEKLLRIEFPGMSMTDSLYVEAEPVLADIVKVLLGDLRMSEMADKGWLEDTPLLANWLDIRIPTEEEVLFLSMKTEVIKAMRGRGILLSSHRDMLSRTFHHWWSGCR
ncbi:hypothetical protein COLO4_38508 [Corchorus olitorius]|uniref:Uncharacterized protein n=1 Tax=Corchorus olitorius TaxID=93759 RepID=A0A1R3FUI2_9ROSI|nr:hypothetical protein COLO4_38508 [Corchorus olitorius]